VESDIERQHVLDTFDQDFSRRLDDKERGVIILIMQRLHFTDLAAHFIELYPRATHVNLPAEAPERTIVHWPGGQRIREKDELLWPEREGPDKIIEAKIVLQSRGYAGQYQQTPTPKTGSIFQPDLYRFYKHLPPLRRLVGSWDTAAKKGQENDYSAYCLWGQATREGGSQLYLLHLFQDKMQLPELKRRVRSLYQSGSLLVLHDGERVRCNLKRPDAILVEDSSAGTAIIQELSSDYGDSDTYIPIVPVKVTTDKIARANAATPMLESGYAQFPDPAVFDVPWLDGLLNSMRRFPVGAHDDDIDSITQALNYIRDNDEPGIIGYYQHLIEQDKAAAQKAKERTQPPSPAELIAQAEEEPSVDDDIAEIEQVYRDARYGGAKT
jgi:predicted phage terminase large subunit-like protein